MENILFPLASSPQRELATPCRVGCPIYTDVQGYVSLIAQGDFQASLELIEEANPLPAVCGRICFHPCESRCRRLQVDEAVAIASLKRAANDLGKRKISRFKPRKKKSEKVAVIGAGPSGLSASRDLALLGYQVTIFDRLPEPGGALRAGIPSYRLPKDVLAADIAEIEKLGVAVRTGIEIGKDLSIEQLSDDGYGSVLISVGLSQSKTLPIAGTDLKGAMLAIPFLKAVNFGHPVSIGKRVAVVGGGDVAIDAARSALRLGAEKVYLVYRRSELEMPARPEELDHAREEGIVFKTLTLPTGIIGSDGQVQAMECLQMELGEPDESGRRRPIAVEGSQFVMEVDGVIIAIGQEADLSFLEGSKLELDERDQLRVDPLRQTTSLPGVFASGEVMTGPGAAIEAIASGKKAAVLIDAYLNGVNLEEIEFEELVPLGELPQETAGKIRRMKRTEMPKVSLKTRASSFDPVELGFSSSLASQEAQRCLNCLAGAELVEDKCTACLTCQRVCPFEAAHVVRGKAEFELERCQACGLCAADCPAEAVSMRGFDGEFLSGKVEKALKKKGSSVLVFSCAYLPAENSAPKAASVEVLCPGRLDANLLLKGFELGAEGILLSLCDDEECRFIKGAERLKQRVGYAQKLLQEIGWSPDRIAFYNPSPEGLAEALARMKKERVRSK